MDLTYTFLDVFTRVFALAIVLGLIAIAVFYVVDVTQTQHAIRRNYPVIGRFRYIF